MFNVFNLRMWDRVDFDRTVLRATFGRIDKNKSRQSNFPRQAQLAMKFIF